MTILVTHCQDVLEQGNPQMLTSSPVINLCRDGPTSAHMCPLPVTPKGKKGEDER